MIYVHVLELLLVFTQCYFLISSPSLGFTQMSVVSNLGTECPLDANHFL